MFLFPLVPDRLLPLGFTLNRTNLVLRAAVRLESSSEIRSERCTSSGTDSRKALMV